MAGVSAHDLFNLARLIVGVFVRVLILAVLKKACDLVDAPSPEPRECHQRAGTNNCCDYLCDG